MKFNHLMNSHFQASGCRLLGEGFDVHRERQVRIYALPGYTDVIGLTDGTDAWIAPAIVGTYFGVDLNEQVRRLQAGQPLLEPGARSTPKRKRVVLDEEEPAPRPTGRARIAVEVDEEPKPRRTRHELV